MNLTITNTIYSDHLTDESVPDEILRRVATRLGELEEAVIRGEYPEATIQTIIRHNVSGVGSGISVEGTEDAEAIASRLHSILAMRADELSEAAWRVR